MPDVKSEVIKAATNEWALLVYRLVTGLCALIITAYVIGTRDDVKAVGKEMSDFRVLYEARVSRIEGQVGELKGSVEAHRMRLTGNDSDIRSIWSRVYDLTGRLGSTPQAK